MLRYASWQWNPPFARGKPGKMDRFPIFLCIWRPAMAGLDAFTSARRMEPAALRDECFIKAGETIKIGLRAFPRKASITFPGMTVWRTIILSGRNGHDADRFRGPFSVFMNDSESFSTKKAWLVPFGSGWYRHWTRRLMIRDHGRSVHILCTAERNWKPHSECVTNYSTPEGAQFIGE